jgi:Heterokaryon incompatibility protein (HET)
MYEIYSKAAQIFVWLGSASDEEEKAFTSIPTIADDLKKIPVQREKDRLHPPSSALNVSSWHSPLWKDIGATYCRAWFSRLRVMQEVYLNSDIFVFCGTKVIPWGNFLLFIENYVGHLLPLHLIAGVDSVRMVWNTFQSIYAIEILKRYTNAVGTQEDRFGLPMFLYSIRTRVSMNPIDKIYGVLAMLPSDINSQ